MIRERNRFGKIILTADIFQQLRIFAHFGLGEINIVDSVIVSWQNGKKQILKNIAADQTITVDIANSVPASAQR